jgi:hypothetical protein
MSTTASVANFYVDRDGHEQPIRFKASDLINKLAPIGYHWEKRHPWDRGSPTRQWVSLNSDKDEAGFYDYYICVKDKDNDSV